MNDTNPPEEESIDKDIVDISDHRETAALSIGVRIALILVGWLVLFVGIAGLVLPGLQGILTILLAAAILSAASDRVHSWTKRVLNRWPALTIKLDAFRNRLLVRLSRRK